MSESSIIARGRLAVLTAHLLGAPLESSEDSDIQRWCVSAQVPTPGDLKGVLTVIDERTGKKYQIQVSQDGTVKASDFKKV
jgi:citrate synthase